ncbi:MAG: molybdopterin-dependent oxidoreductase [Chthoniobacterales bacterium]|nr:molybdopterin-dependent oxidoreductase [Chthoniobacterales bacterium]
MIHFDEAHRAVYYPKDRRFRVWIRPSFLLVLLILALCPFILAWVQNASFGLPHISPSAASQEGTASGPHGFPFWIRGSHFANLFFLFMLMRSGLSILMEHPRLYLNDDCTPGTEWIRFTPLRVPLDRVWTAKQDGRYISPLVATPGYTHTVGIARSWHFITVYGFVLTGVFFVIGLLTTEQWRRLVPTSPDILVQAWNTFVHYANFRLPPEPNGFYGYNALQQLAYFATIFIMAPLSILTGMAMSPALVNRFPVYARLFGGRQSARSLHFLMLVGFVGFTIVHVTLVAMTGFSRNMNHIVLGTDNLRPLGMILGLAGIAVVILSWIVAHYVSWFFPRYLQHAQKAMTQPAKLVTLDRLLPSQHYRKDQISPRFWPNGKMPVREDWKQLAADDFKDYKLKVAGLVENPVELSLTALRALGGDEFITMHHCIQGWTGIAQWGGLPMEKLIEHVRPKPSAKVIAFYSYGPSLFTPTYYDTQQMENALKPECILAFEMNGEPLPAIHGAPLRLRVENQLGYKMVKWIERIEFVESEKQLGKGEGGSNEDDEYFDLLPNI